MKLYRVLLLEEDHIQTVFENVFVLFRRFIKPIWKRPISFNVPFFVQREVFKMILEEDL